MAASTLITLELPHYGEDLAIVVTSRNEADGCGADHEVDQTLDRLTTCLLAAGLGPDMTVVPDPATQVDRNLNTGRPNRPGTEHDDTSSPASPFQKGQE